MNFTDVKMHVKISKDLLRYLLCSGVDINDAAATFYEKADRVRRCQPNYNYFGQKANAWILREYYGDTSIFFKMTLSYHTKEDIAKRDSFFDGTDYSEYNDTIYVNVKMCSSKSTVSVNLSNVSKYLLEKAEYKMLDSDKLPDSFLPPVKKYRCMYPKGYN